MLTGKNKTAEGCIFCRREVIEKSFFSTDRFSAFYNIAPVLPGHSLVIPKKHYQSLFELSDDELGEMMGFARRVTLVLKTVFGCSGFDWTIQDGASAGQTVPHLHLHIIPRKANDMDGAGEWYSSIPENEKQLIDSELRNRLNTSEYDAITKELREISSKLI